MLMLVGLMYPQTALSDQDKIWKNGDIVATKVVCETEDAILELTGADINGPESNVMVVITNLVANRQCTAFPFPLKFMVTKALVHYKDHKEIPSVILGVNAGNGEWIGWLIAAGRYRETGI
jgi:hypothetical protein